MTDFCLNFEHFDYMSGNQQLRIANAEFINSVQGITQPVVKKFIRAYLRKMEKIRFIDDQGFENLSYFEEYCIDSFGQKTPLYPIVPARDNIEPFEPGDIRGYFRMDIFDMLQKRKDIESIFQTIYKANRPWK